MSSNSELKSAASILATAALVALVAASPAAFAQGAASPGSTPTPGPAAAVELPVTRVSLFSSGVGYFELRGRVSGDATVALPFRAEEVNDALKSLVVWDSPSGSGSPSVSYPSQEGLDRVLRGFRVDLSGSPKVADMLARLRGAEIAVDAPQTISGRIVSVESRPWGKEGAPSPWLVLLTAQGVRAVALNDISVFRFPDQRISGDFDRALALILGAQDSLRRVLELRLPGSGTREAALGYVVAAPVWKVSYRLDLAGAKPWLQGWAIVDNPTDQDWKGVTLSLVSGRPVSFQQDLYTPLWLDRPMIPLAIAGTAAPRTYDSGMAGLDDLYADEAPAPPASVSRELSRSAPAPAARKSAESQSSLRGGAAGPGAPRLEIAQASGGTTLAQSAGDQFEFTVRRPVTLERRRSAMIPLIAGDLAAEKVSVFSPGSGSSHPMLGVRISNSTGMKLPAGPITVFDGGAYAGDALIDFLPEKDKRLVVYGEDLSVTGEVSSSSSQETVGVTVAKGVMTFSRRVTYTRTYAFRNASATARRLVVEHAITAGSELFEPKAYDEKAGQVYRFPLALPAGAEAKLAVKERAPAQERVVLSSLGADSFLAYSSSQEIPAAVREALRKAMDLRRKAEDAKRALADLQSRKSELSSDQSRLRSNLDAVGRDSSQGKQYLAKLMDSENEIDGLTARINDARKYSQDAQSAYESYIGNLTLN